MKSIKMFSRFYRKNLVYILLFTLVPFLLGLLMVLLINALFNQDPDYAPMGTFFALIISILCSIITRDHSQMFLAVGMGQTRRAYLVCTTLLNALFISICLILCRLLYAAEIALLYSIYPGFENAMPLDFLFSLPVMGMLVVTVVCFKLFFSMIITHFGAKGFTLLWFIIWLGFMFVSRCIGAAAHRESGILAVAGGFLVDLAQSVPVAGWIRIGFAVVFLIAAAGFLGLRKVEIRL